MVSSPTLSQLNDDDPLAPFVTERRPFRPFNGPFNLNGLEIGQEEKYKTKERWLIALLSLHNDFSKSQIKKVFSVNSPSGTI